MGAAADVSRAATGQPTRVVVTVAPASLPEFGGVLAGSVVVWQGTPLHPTAAAAAAAAEEAAAAAGEAEGLSRRGVTAYRVIANRGDVVQLRTARGAGDCEAGPEIGYELDVFVAKTALLARLAAPITVAYGDGTGVHVAIGAPAIVRNDGSTTLLDPLLARAAPVRIDQLVLSSWPPPTPTVGPPALPGGGETLVCDPLPEATEAWEMRKDLEARAEREREVHEREARAQEAASARRQPRRKTQAKASDLGDLLGDSTSIVDAFGDQGALSSGGLGGEASWLDR